MMVHHDYDDKYVKIEINADDYLPQKEALGMPQKCMIL